MHLVLKTTKLKDKLGPCLHQLVKLCSLTNTSSPLFQSARRECMEEDDWGQSREQKQKWKRVISQCMSQITVHSGKGTETIPQRLIQRQLLYNIAPSPVSCGRSFGNAHRLCEFQRKEWEWAARTALLSLLPNLPPWPACFPAFWDLMWMSTATSGAVFKGWQSCRMEGVWLPDSLLGGQPPAN